ncbi:histidine phosphatase family protein [Streptococcus pluranimalium]
MLLYFVRHGKTEWNEEGRFQGANGDSPLLKEAYADISKLGQVLAPITFDKAFSSDLKRAKDTAQLLMANNHKPQVITETKALREWALGKLEGQKISLVEAIYPSQMQAFRQNLGIFRPHLFEAESVFQATHRLETFLKENLSLQEDHVLLVGHGAHLTASIRYLLGYEPAHLRAAGGLDNASLTILETDDLRHYKLLSWNDTSHYKS